jgi:hypothetical protein
MDLDTIWKAGHHILQHARAQNLAATCSSVLCHDCSGGMATLPVAVVKVHEAVASSG